MAEYCHNSCSSVRLLPAQWAQTPATPFVNCIVNDGLVNAVPNMKQTLLQFISVVHCDRFAAGRCPISCSRQG